MTREEKYKAWEDIFYKYFIYKSDTFLSESGCDLPLASVNFDKLSGFSGDGIIDLSYYIQYAYTKYLLGNKVELVDSLSTLERLQIECYTLFSKKYPNIYFKDERGFLLRDDIKSSDASKFHLNSVDTSYTRGEELINNYDKRREI